jgi:hypothetical protein
MPYLMVPARVPPDGPVVRKHTLLNITYLPTKCRAASLAHRRIIQLLVELGPYGP